MPKNLKKLLRQMKRAAMLEKAGAGKMVVFFRTRKEEEENGSEPGMVDRNRKGARE